jgi:hypothetical protein
MKRRDFNRFALGIGLSPILANAQVVGQTETFAQPPNVVADDPMAAVRKYVDAFNQGDAAVMATTFAVPGSILDGMAPHVWQGPTATQDWYREEMYWLRVSNMVLRIISSLWASHCTTPSPATARMWSFPQP